MGFSTQGDKGSSAQGNEGFSTQGDKGFSTQAKDGFSTHGKGKSREQPLDIPDKLKLEIGELKQKEHNSQKVRGVIIKLCSIRAFTSNEIAKILNKRDDYIRKKYLNKMIKEKEIRYQFPEMIKHPEQAYITNTKK